MQTLCNVPKLSEKRRTRHSDLTDAQLLMTAATEDVVVRLPAMWVQPSEYERTINISTQCHSCRSSATLAAHHRPSKPY
jgi:hypothetical protein